MAPCHPVRDSPLIDFLEGRPIEVGPIFAEPARRARAGGIPTPGLDQLAALLARLDPAPRSSTQVILPPAAVRIAVRRPSDGAWR